MRVSTKRTPAPGVSGAPFVLFVLLAAIAVLGPGAAEAQNQPPTISGQAPEGRVGWWYKFKPTVSDPDNATRTLRFTIVNKPAWATFSIYGGGLEGTPDREGTWSNIRITVRDYKSSAALPAFAIKVVPKSGGGSGGDRPPTISGSPGTSIRAGTAYTFTPTASDPNGDRLTFSIQNRPSWAAFSTSNGRLSGTPASAQVGTYSNVIIRVSDGRTTVSLPAFAIAVTDVAMGSATMSWVAPTSNTNGSTLTNLAGYRIYYGTSSNAMNRTIQISNPGMASYVVENLSPATYYFSIKAYSSSGAESAASNVASKTVR